MPNGVHLGHYEPISVKAPESGMLLKYLNQLDDAVRELATHPGPDAVTRRDESVRVLEDYLNTQMEPVARRGREIMRQCLARADHAGPAPVPPETGRPGAALSGP